jgi:hypothetical protein
MSHGKSKKHRYESRKFSKKDTQRVARLREEIIARVTEISLIMARTLDIKPPTQIREFTMTDGPDDNVLDMTVIKSAEPASAGASVEIITWGCTCHTQKICCSDPDCPPCP